MSRHVLFFDRDNLVETDALVTAALPYQGAALVRESLDILNELDRLEARALSTTGESPELARYLGEIHEHRWSEGLRLHLGKWDNEAAKWRDPQ